MRNSRGCRTFLAGLLKLFNFVLAFIGAALLLYALWVLYKLPSSLHSELVPSTADDVSTFLKPESFSLERTVLESQDPLGHLHGEGNLRGNVDFNVGEWNLPTAWFVYLLLGLGVFLCLISFLGHIAAEISNGCCLSCYVFFVVLLILLQGAFVADVFFNDHWEDGIPDDPTGLFTHIKQFVKENLDVLKWVGLAIVFCEVLAVLLATCMRALTSNTRQGAYDSDDEYLVLRSSSQPIVINRQVPEATMGNMGTVDGWPNRADAWSTRMREKYGLTGGQRDS